MSENQLTLAEQLANVPAFLVDSGAPTGLENVQQYMMPSFLRIVQSMSGRDIKDAFDEGDVILQPDKQGVYCPKKGGEPVPFTPLFLYTEYCIWNPLKTKGQLPFIRERSTDPNGVIAQKCRNKEARNEPCPEMPTENLRYVEHMNFLVLLRTPDAPKLPVIMSFVVGEFMTGRKFCNLIGMRGPNIPLYAGVYQFTTSIRTNARGESWFGFDIINHESNPWVSKEEFDVLTQSHLGLIQKFQDGEIKADYEEGFGAVDPNVVGTHAGVDVGIPTDGPIIEQAGANPAI